MLSSFCSSNEFVINCKPIGRLFSSFEKGMDIPGMPAKFTGTVKISLK